MISFLFFRVPTLFPRTLGSGRLNGVWPLIRALFLAPLPVALVVAVLGAVWSWSTGEGLAGAALAVVPYLYTFGLTLILGVPAFILLRFLSVNTWCGVALTGSLLSLLPIGFIWLLSEVSTREITTSIPPFSGLGAITATAFHFAYTWRLDGDAHDSQSPSAASRDYKS